MELIANLMKTYILGTDKWTLLVNFIGIICPDDGKKKLVSLGNIQGIFQ